MLNNAVLSKKCTICFKNAYFCCFSLGGKLYNPDCFQKTFYVIDSTKMILRSILKVSVLMKLNVERHLTEVGRGQLEPV